MKLDLVVHGAKKFFNVILYVLDAFLPRLAFAGPRPPRVQNVPSGTKAFVTARTWVVIAEAVNQAVPQWRKLGDQERFAQWNPDVIHHQVAALKVLEIQIGDGLDRLGMFTQAIEKRFAL